MRVILVIRISSILHCLVPARLASVTHHCANTKAGLKASRSAAGLHSWLEGGNIPADPRVHPSEIRPGHLQQLQRQDRGKSTASHVLITDHRRRLGLQSVRSAIMNADSCSQGLSASAGLPLVELCAFICLIMHQPASRGNPREVMEPAECLRADQHQHGCYERIGLRPVLLRSGEGNLKDLLEIVHR